METIEKLFSFIDEYSEEVAKEHNITYLEGVLETLNTWLDGDRKPSINELSKEEIRKAIQLAILKGMRKSAQPNHQMTPDSLGLLLGYFVEQFYEKEFKSDEKITVLDPAIGTGNLLLTVMNLVGDKIEGTGVEIDDLLIQLAAASGELEKQPISLYCQDALENLLIDPVDAVICDLPVGYYPNDEVAKQYEVKSSEGMTYAHHLFIEQSLKYVKDGGYLFFLVPDHIFESEQSSILNKLITSKAWIQAVVQLPEELFSNKAHAKSLFILQKKNDTGEAVKEVLLARVPNMKNIKALELFFAKVRKWKKEQKKF
ncbi:class I SAM-dependent methyltransferase [Rummeliibacillus sp. POC4]|uniref:class I SAM-dependent methyltransferase n=1 Tax=Rummeliibacillus sp. POC4 TaxID=2305899 RepID=UPI000E66113F|nr:class I SAM-dependent methyltransferase [Rummeliibacillus sp. POC4]RIJ66713.1 class I SAM-dependent methyltransferase [Rummeliibacillus sp. POC4]